MYFFHASSLNTWTRPNIIILLFLFGSAGVWKEDYGYCRRSRSVHVLGRSMWIEGQTDYLITVLLLLLMFSHRLGQVQDNLGSGEVVRIWLTIRQGCCCWGGGGLRLKHYRGFTLARMLSDQREDLFKLNQGLCCTHIPYASHMLHQGSFGCEVLLWAVVLSWQDHSILFWN